MTLLELLVKELPSRGGWPSKACVAKSYSHIPDALFWDDNGITVPFYSLSRLAIGDYCVTREQYEAASEWNGEGLPPVGTECEWYDVSVKGGWVKVKIMYLSHWLIVMRSIENNFGHGVDVPRDLVMGEKPQFRPIRTEADSKREEAVTAIYKQSGIRPRDGGQQVANDIYDAIAAHKILGVTTIPNIGEIMRATESCSREDAQKIVDLLNGA